MKSRAYFGNIGRNGESVALFAGLGSFVNGSARFAGPVVGQSGFGSYVGGFGSDVDPSTVTTDADGDMVDANGNLVNAQGDWVDENGSHIDANGNLVKPAVSATPAGASGTIASDLTAGAGVLNAGLGIYKTVTGKGGTPKPAASNTMLIVGVVGLAIAGGAAYYFLKK